MSPGEQTRDYYRKQGAQAERDRIIEILENTAEITGYVEIELGKLVALIKGNKVSDEH